MRGATELTFSLPYVTMTLCHGGAVLNAPTFAVVPCATTATLPWLQARMMATSTTQPVVTSTHTHTRIYIYIPIYVCMAHHTAWRSDSSLLYPGMQANVPVVRVATVCTVVHYTMHIECCASWMLHWLQAQSLWLQAQEQTHTHAPSLVWHAHEYAKHVTQISEHESCFGKQSVPISATRCKHRCSCLTSCNDAQIWL